jgi:hypothetical protein
MGTQEAPVAGCQATGKWPIFDPDLEAFQARFLGRISTGFWAFQAAFSR